jgi:hypothetical protein
MRDRRSRSSSLADWPPTLRYVIQSAQRECPRGHADALAELTALAFRKVPSRGVFDPAARGEDDLYAAIESVARTHFRYGEARAAWRRALDAAALDLTRRDDIERAAQQVQAASDSAYFYAGLAFGLAAISLYRTG